MINKKMRKVFFVISVIFSIISIEGMAISQHNISLDIKNIGHDDYYNANKLSANISVDTPGHLTYMEEYYTIDSDSNPKLCCSGKYYDGLLTQNIATNGTFYNASFDIFRPLPHKGKTYTLIKGIVLLNGSRVYEKWLTKNVTFIDNTDSGISDKTPESGNIVIYETKENILYMGHPVSFVYTTIDPIYEINATGTGNTVLRVEILKDAPSFTYLSKGIAYRYINIVTDNYKIDQLLLRYKIENSWMINGSIDNLGLFRWDINEKIWSGLPTKTIDKDDRYTYFESVYTNLSTSSLSPFAIIGTGPRVKSPSVESPYTDNVPIETPRSVVVRPIKKTPGFGIVSGMCIFLLSRIIKRGLKKESL